MSKVSNKKLFDLKAWTQGSDDMYTDSYDQDFGDMGRDFSNVSSKSVKLFFLKEANEFRQVTDFLKKGSVCVINLSALDKETSKVTLYRIEGILDALNGSKECAGDNTYILLPGSFALQVINESEEARTAEFIKQ